MVNPNIVRNYENIFFQGQLRKLVSLIKGDENATSIQKKPSLELPLLLSSAYYELGEKELAKATIKEAIDSSNASTDGCIYACARLCFLNGEFDNAEDLFNELIEYTNDEEYQFKALMGLGNTVYAKAALGKIDTKTFKQSIDPIIFDLENCLPEGKDHLKISLETLKGHCKRTLKEDHIDEILVHYKNVIKIASRNNWTYFQAKGLYGQAAVYQTYGELSKMKWCLDLLDAFVDENEMIFFSNVVMRRMFEQYYETTSLPVKFDSKNQRIKFGDVWTPLHDRPLIYRFLESIQATDSFISKSEVAKNLWPDQEYKPRIHDPRIFDVAKRAKNLITENSDSLRLLSGRVGYKLINE